MTFDSYTEFPQTENVKISQRVTYYFTSNNQCFLQWLSVRIDNFMDMLPQQDITIMALPNHCTGHLRSRAILLFEIIKIYFFSVDFLNSPF